MRMYLLPSYGDSVRVRNALTLFTFGLKKKRQGKWECSGAGIFTYSSQGDSGLNSRILVVF